MTINHPNQSNFRATWQALLWRLLLTLLLLLILATSGLTVFTTVTTPSDTNVLPPLTHGVEVGR